MNIEILPDKAYKKKSLFGSLIGAFFTFIFLEIIHLIVFNTDGGSSGLNFVFISLNLLSIFLFFIVGLPLRFLWIKNLKYFVSEERITISKGILSKIEINIPFKNITDFKLIRSPFDRLLGIGSIIAQTAGQGSPMPEGLMSGLKEYESLHEGLKQRLADYESRKDSPSKEEKSISDLYEELVKIRSLLEKNN